MKCRFCNTDMLPDHRTRDIDEYVTCGYIGLSNIKEWWCHSCPSTVKQPDSKSLDWFSILAMYNGSWYEVVQMYTMPDTKEPPLLSIFKTVYFKHGVDNSDCIRSEFVLELNIDAHITPENINSKLATILTFS